jgi:TonB family protein
MLVAAGAIVSAMLAPSVSAKRVDLEPSGKWNVDFGIEKCRLARYFGEGDDRHLLMFDQYGPSEGFGMTASGPAFERFQSRKRTSLSFAADGEAMRTEPYAGSVDGVGGAVIYSYLSLASGTEELDNPAAQLPQLDPELGDEVAYVRLTQGGRDILLNTGPLGEAFKILNLCTQQLVKDWGLDPDKHLTAQRQVRWLNQEDVVRRIQSDYPRAALFKGEQGIMRMRVMVDETGAVTDCAILEATRVESLESPACREMKRAEFAPALDEKGDPFPSYYATSIVYRIGS